MFSNLRASFMFNGQLFMRCLSQGVSYSFRGYSFRTLLFSAHSRTLACLLFKMLFASRPRYSKTALPFLFFVIFTVSVIRRVHDHISWPLMVQLICFVLEGKLHLLVLVFKLRMVCHIASFTGI